MMDRMKLARFSHNVLINSSKLLCFCLFVASMPAPGRLIFFGEQCHWREGFELHP
jgi:hypothetical protein